MIKTIFTFFQVQIESLCRHAIELLQPSFSIRPKAFYSVDMNIADGKHIFGMIDSKVLAVTDINQSIITTPAIRIEGDKMTGTLSGPGLPPLTFTATKVN